MTEGERAATVAALLAAIADNFTTQLTGNAVFLAERLYELQPVHRHLFVLASAHVRDGDTVTAHRLLQSRYPFLDPRVAARQPFRTPGSHTQQQQSASAAERGPSSPHPRDDPDGDAARWDCHYLFAVCCVKTKRLAEGQEVLQELERVSLQLRRGEEAAAVSSLRPARGDSEDEEGAARRAAQSQSDRNDSALSRLLQTLGSCTAGRPRYYTDRMPEVHYWQELCRKQMPTSWNGTRTTVSFMEKPALFTGLEVHMRTVQQPTPAAELDAVVNHAFSPSSPTSAGVMAAAAPHLRGLTRAPPATGSSASRQEQQEEEEALRRFLHPFARATALLHSFRCADALAVLAKIDTASGAGGAADAPLPSTWRLSSTALALFHLGDMAGCATAFERLLAAAPWRLNNAALIYYSTALWQLRAEGALVTLAQRLTESMPLSPITLCVVANTYSLAQEPKDALTMLARAVQVDDDLAYGHALRGYELLSLGMTKEAKDAFNKALNVDHNMYTAYAGLGELCVREEQIEQARRYFKQAIAINPLPTILNRYGATYHRRGASRQDLHTAFRIYDEAVAKNANNLSARHQRADMMLQLGEVHGAVGELLAMIEQHPEESMLYVTLARCQEARGRVGEAVELYHRAMALDPRREGHIRSCIERLSAAAAAPTQSPRR